MSVVSLVEGSVFAERYQIGRCIAAGGMGAVYEVIHLETQRRRALKVMHPQYLESDDLRERFRLEAKVAAGIESEHVVDVFDAGIDAATQMPFLVMELLRGEELGRLLRQKGRFTAAEVVTYLHQAALALDKTHQARIVHRDLKPENLFLTWRENGTPRIKVLDFGIAKVEAEGGTQANATRSIGTPLYMAPEQFQPGHRVLPATDLYALAMVAYTLLVGRAYWSEEAAEYRANVFAFAAAVLHGPSEAATARAARAGVTLPPELDGWFARATSATQGERFPTAIAMIWELADALGMERPGLEGSGPISSMKAPPSMPRPVAATTTGAGLATTKGEPLAATKGEPLAATKKPTLRWGRAIALGAGAGGLMAVCALGGAALLRAIPGAEPWTGARGGESRAAYALPAATDQGKPVATVTSQGAVTVVTTGEPAPSGTVSAGPPAATASAEAPGSSDGRTAMPRRPEVRERMVRKGPRHAWD